LYLLKRIIIDDLVYLVMLTNIYLIRLVKTYGAAVIDDNKIAELAKKAAKLTPEVVGIDESELNKAVARIMEATKDLGIDLERMSAEDLTRFLLGLFKNLSGLSKNINDKTIEKSSVALTEELKMAMYNRSGYRYNYGKSNRPFSSTKTFSKITMAIAMIPTFISILTGGKLNAANLISLAANNKNLIEKVVEKTVIENISPKDSLIKYPKGIKSDKSHMEIIELALERIKSSASTRLYEVYKRFYEAGALAPLPEDNSLDTDTKIALRIYKSAQIMYNQFRGKESVPFDTILSREKTEKAARYIILAAISYNILGQLDYSKHGLTSNQIELLKEELRAGKYEVKFKSDNKIVINTVNDTLDIEFIFDLHAMQVIGLNHAQDILRQSQYYDTILKNLATYKSAIAPVERTPLYDIYVVLPVSVTNDAMKPIHEIAFRIRCGLETYVYTKDSSGLSLVRSNLGASQLRDKKTKLFRRRKKYDWM
jgi:hypothetical protein